MTHCNSSLTSRCELPQTCKHDPTQILYANHIVSVPHYCDQNVICEKQRTQILSDQRLHQKRLLICLVGQGCIFNLMGCLSHTGHLFSGDYIPSLTLLQHEYLQDYSRCLGIVLNSDQPPCGVVM